MKKIILARHAEKLDESYDPDLTNVGKIQAFEISRYLNESKVDVVLTSMLKRSIETAEIIMEGKQKVPTSRSLNLNEYYVRREDGEGVEGTRNGVTRALSKIYSYYDLFDTALIVAHSSINQAIVRGVCNLPYRDSEKLFRNYGEVIVIRNDYKKGDDNWTIVDTFLPQQI